jgi:hypothetical protein
MANYHIEAQTDNIYRMESMRREMQGNDIKNFQNLNQRSLGNAEILRLSAPSKSQKNNKTTLVSPNKFKLLKNLHIIINPSLNSATKFPYPTMRIYI